MAGLQAFDLLRRRFRGASAATKRRRIRAAALVATAIWNRWQVGIRRWRQKHVRWYLSYVVLDAGMTDLERGQLLTDEQYLDTMEQWGDEFEAKMGAEAIYNLLRNIDLNEEVNKLREEIGGTRSVTKLKRLSKRVKLVEAFIDSGNKPEWMILEVLPVIPPESSTTVVTPAFATRPSVWSPGSIRSTRRATGSGSAASAPRAAYRKRSWSASGTSW